MCIKKVARELNRKGTGLALQWAVCTEKPSFFPLNLTPWWNCHSRVSHTHIVISRLTQHVYPSLPDKRTQSLVLAVELLKAQELRSDFGSCLSFSPERSTEARISMSVGNGASQPHCQKCPCTTFLARTRDEPIGKIYGGGPENDTAQNIFWLKTRIGGGKLSKKKVRLFIQTQIAV